VAAPQAAPRPVQAAQAQQVPVKPSEAGKATPGKAGSAFRETLWFKQGDVEQMVADAKSKLQSAGKPANEGPVIAEDARPLEDRYVDDGSVTVEDRKKFSLRTGGTATALPTAGPAVPGEKMDEREMVGEISGGRRTLILVIAAVVILALVVVIAMMVKGKGKGSVTGPTVAPTGTLAASAPAPSPTPTANGPGVPSGQLSNDADIATGPAAPPGSPPPTKAAPALGVAGGTTKPNLGDAAGETKPGTAQAKKAVVIKKKPVVKHPPKRKR
jgi:hypothetical protein